MRRLSWMRAGASLTSERTNDMSARELFALGAVFGAGLGILALNLLVMA